MVIQDAANENSELAPNEFAGKIIEISRKPFPFQKIHQTFCFKCDVFDFLP